MTKLVVKAKEAIQLIQTAVGVREEITEHYKQYRALTEIAVYAADVSHADIKKAVDAIHYLGGGWPTPNSKGRMEALLDNFAGMFRVLDFIGRGDLVHEHLAQYGINVSIAEDKKIQDQELSENEIKFLDHEYSSEYFNISDIRNLRDLITAIVEECNELQTIICKKADLIKDELRPAAKGTLELEDAEYDRLHDFVKLAKKDESDKTVSKKAKINTSLSAYNVGLSTLGDMRG